MLFGLEVAGEYYIASYTSYSSDAKLISHLHQITLAHISSAHGLKLYVRDQSWVGVHDLCCKRLR